MVPADNTTINYNTTTTDGYHITVPFMLIFSLLPLIINLHMVLCIFWIKLPLKPKSLLSMSLATADATNAAFYFINILVITYLDTFMDISCVIANLIIICWQSSVIIGIYHMLALSLLHYTSIVQPMQYKFRITRKITFIIIWLLWTKPFLITVLFFVITDLNTWSGVVCKNSPVTYKLSYRVSFLMIFTIPLPVIIFFYSRIVYSLRKQGIRWQMLSRGGSRKNFTNSRFRDNDLKELYGYKKSVVTTLLILASYLIGWLPHLLISAFVCNQHCLYSAEDVENYSKGLSIFLGVLPHIFILLKSFVNPFIYASRVQKLQEGRALMHQTAKRVFYKICTRTEYRQYPEIPRSNSAPDVVQEQLFLCDSTTGSLDDSDSMQITSL